MNYLTMKWSQFNCLVKTAEGLHFLHNTRMGCLLKLDKETYSKMEALRKNPSQAQNQLGADVLAYVIKNKILVEEDEDNAYVQMLEYRKRRDSFHSDNLALVIAPTLGCNFACPYCYEKDLPGKAMEEPIQRKVVDFANRYEKVCRGLSLNWHGGEPLLAFGAIKNLYRLLEQDCKLPIVRSTIVTNGSLLTEEMCAFFAKKKLDYIQITIDGQKDVHDRTRVQKNGEGSYETIIRNIDMAVQLMPNCKIGVRTNIGKDNRKGYADLYRELSNRWKETNVSPYFTWVSDTESACRGCKEFSFELTTDEKNAFEREMVKEGIIGIHALPTYLDSTIRTCDEEYGFVIDPEGNVYKCWVDIGKADRRIGNLDTGVEDYGIVSEFVIGSDKFSDRKCRKCHFLPTCDGGCSLKRINARKHHVPANNCCINMRGLRKHLSLYDRLSESSSKNKQEPI